MTLFKFPKVAFGMAIKMPQAQNKAHGPKIRTEEQLLKIAGRFGARRHRRYQHRFPQPQKPFWS